MPFKPVDAAIKVIVGPAIDDGDFKTREEGLTYDQAGMEVDVILEKYDGTIVTTAVVPTAAGDYDWAHTDQGFYELELPAAAGASFNNTEEGIITIAVFCTGVLPFRSVSYDIIESQAYDALVKGTDALQVDAVEISGDATAANNAELAFDGTGFGFTNCTMPTVTTLSGHTAQTGDNFARIGATGSALTSLAQASICTETRLAELAAANIPTDIDTLLTRVTAAVALASVCTEARLAELDAANLPTDIANVKAETALIVADTNELQTDWEDGGRLDLLLDACALEATVAALNNISNANVRTQCDDALTNIKLDHLVAVADGDDPVNGSIIAMLAASDGDWSGFAIADDSLEAIRNRGDAAWTTGAGGTVPSLLQNTTIASLASQTSFTLTAGSVDDDAYNGAIIVITDAVSGVQKAVGRISDYIGASKTITLKEDPGIFTMADGDTVDVIATDKLFIGYTDTRAGYLDELAAANLPSDVDDLLTRLSAARAGYLDNLSAGAVALAATALTNATWTDAKAGYLNHSVATIDTNVDDLLTRITAARAGYLDELAAANLPSDVDDLLTRLSAARAGYLDELAAANIPADIDTLKTNVPDVISLANIRTQADNALIAINLDHLLKIAVDTNWATTVHLDSALGHMVDVGAAATFDRTTDSNEAIRNRGDAAWITGAGGTPPNLLQNTTIATLASQTSFTLTAGSVDDDAYNTAIIVITDSVTAEQKAVGWVENYIGATKTIVLTSDPGIFTMAVGDTVDIIATDYLMANIWATVASTFTQIGIDGAGLTNMPWNGSWDAEVQSEVNDALVAFFTSADELVDNIWDEILSGATHNIATSAGRRVREIGAYAIQSGTAQGGNTIHITLAATASATDGIYNRNLLVIVGGTGAGQTRTIVDYVGSTKVALADREWRVSPDATSEYQIVPDDTPLVADHGLARAGTVNTIQLRTYASAVDSIYNGAIIAIIAGTGRGESRIVESYVGATRTATVCDDWDVTPDTTSVYVMMPYGMAAVVCIGADPLADIKTQADSALSDVNLDHLIQLALTVNDGAPNAADFITSSAVAIDDWYNENMLLFTSGALAGLARFIDDYDGATKRIYLAEAFPQAPANTDAFVIVGVSGSAPTATAVADAVWDELEAGHTIAGSFGEEVTKQGKKLDRNLILDL